MKNIPSLYLNFGHVRVSMVFVFAFLIIYILNPVEYVAIMLVSAAVHEGGHILCALCLGRRIEEFELAPFGAQIQLDKKLSSYTADILLSVAGAAANVCAGVSAMLFYRLHPSEDLFFLMLTNFTLAAVNMLPMNGFDGAAALYAAIAGRYDCFAASRTVNAVSGIFCIIIAAGAIWMSFRFGFNFSLVLIVSAAVFEAARGIGSSAGYEEPLKNRVDIDMRHE